MECEILGYEIKNKVVMITAVDVSEEHLQKVERNREDDFQRELEFTFTNKQALAYLTHWLHSQRIIKTAKPATWGEALSSVVGTITNLSGKYLNRD